MRVVCRLNEDEVHQAVADYVAKHAAVEIDAEFVNVNTHWTGDDEPQPYIVADFDAEVAKR